MKRILFFQLILFLLFTGCGEFSGDEYIDSDNYVTRWISISIEAPTETRSDLTRTPQFEEGSSKEHAIKSISFYFFDSSENSLAVGNDGKSYITFTNAEATPDSNPSDSPEAIVKPALQLNFENKTPPSYVVVIINPTSALQQREIKKIQDLRDIAEDYEDTASLGFIMSNAVYKTSAGSKFEAVPITSQDLYATQEEAARHPVSIFVERVVAKISMVVSNPTKKTDSGELMYKTTNTDSGNEDIYVKLLGWSVTAKTDKTRLLKEINPGWDDRLFGGKEIWNDYANCRSYWAINAEEVEFNYLNFNDAQKIKYFEDSPDDSKANYTYVNENAAKNWDGEDSDVPTCIIAAAQLVDSSGKALDYAEYGGKKYTKEGVLNLIASGLPYYKKNNTENKYDHIDPADLEFALNDSEKVPAYVVKVRLKDKNTEWFINPETNPEEIVNDAIDAELLSLCNKNRAKVWEEGHTYYYADILHTGEAGSGEKGVVRNNHYRLTVTGINGIGTPVFDPSQVIIPEQTQETSLIINVDVIDWRLLKQSLEIAW